MNDKSKQYDPEDPGTWGNEHDPSDMATWPKVSEMTDEQRVDLHKHFEERRRTEERIANQHASNVWNRLSKIDVGPYVQTKGDGQYRASYISWSTAWTLLMNEFPESVWIRNGVTKHDDNTCTVQTRVVVIENGKHQSHDMDLPVMNHKFMAVQDPNARQISDSYFRCLVKNLALFGLGLDLWADTDGPVGTVNDPIDEDRLEVIESLLDQSGADRARFLKWAGVEDTSEIPNVKYKAARSRLEYKIRQKGEYKIRQNGGNS